MGTPLPEISPPGEFANFCWSTGAYHNPTDPPAFLTMDVSGILKGDLWTAPDPEPPNGRFVIPQDSTTEWIFNTPAIIFAVGWNSINTQFFIFIGPPVSEVAFDSVGSTCQNLLNNSFVLPAGRHYYGGSVRALGIS